MAELMPDPAEQVLSHTESTSSFGCIYIYIYIYTHYMHIHVYTHTYTHIYTVEQLHACNVFHHLQWVNIYAALLLLMRIDNIAKPPPSDRMRKICHRIQSAMRFALSFKPKTPNLCPPAVCTAQQTTACSTWHVWARRPT